MKRLFKKGQKFNDWQLTSFLGGGGNGEVWACINSKGQESAIKLLKKIRPKAYNRFIDEIDTILKNSDIKGIIPITEKFLPQKLNGLTPYFIMPIAEPSEEILTRKSIDEKIDAIIEVGETLAELHNREIFHRDIKPANILFYNNIFSLADFGLVQYPNKREISIKNEEIGPKWTMAPEMRRESSTADAAKADVYSLSKTLWIFLTDRKKGFDGQYSVESVVDLKKFYPQTYTSPIDNLLISCTDNDPTKRPTIKHFISSLQEWKELSRDFHRQNQQQWFEIQTKLFPTSIPQRVIWKDINDIIKVLKIVCSFDSLNHMFMPNSGGLDLVDARLSHEVGCIELDFQLIDIVKPKRLIFESFNYDYEWNYFRLELDELQPSSVLEIDQEEAPMEKKYIYEEVSELSPANYYPHYILEDRDHYKDDFQITDFSRQITRWFEGSFVIFCKRSTYNLDSSTYDGRHNNMTTDEFREYIQRSINDLKDAREIRTAKAKVAIKENKNTKRINHFVEEKIIYRCGWCGNLVDSDGGELDSDSRNYSIKVLEKFGDGVVEITDGYCCKDKQS